MLRQPPRSKRTDPPLPYTTLFRSFGALARRDLASHLVLHIAGERRIAVGDRLALAHQAAQRLHQRLSLGFLRRVVQLLIGIGRRRQPVLRRQRRREQRQDRRDQQPRAHFIASSRATIRSEERRVGKECVSRFRSWWSPYL